MDKRDDGGFLVEPPAELDAKVMSKVAPVLKQNHQIHHDKRWFQLWMPLGSTAALTLFGVWFLNRKSIQVPTDHVMDEDDLVKDLVGSVREMDLQSFAALDLNDDDIELVSNLDVIEDLELFEKYSEEDENS